MNWKNKEKPKKTLIEKIQESYRYRIQQDKYNRYYIMLKLPGKDWEKATYRFSELDQQDIFLWMGSRKPAEFCSYNEAEIYAKNRITAEIDDCKRIDAIDEFNRNEDVKSITIKDLVKHGLRT